MKLLQLRAFVTIVETGSFSEAALVLDTSQSAVSYAVTELERDLGVRLLERGRFGARPTETGLQIAASARQMLQLEAAIEQQAGLARGVVKGELRVAAFRSVASRIMPGIIAALRRDFPELSLRMMEIEGDVLEVEQVLHQGLAEVAFTQTPFPDDFISWGLMRDPYIALLPRGHALAGRMVRREDLAGFPLVLYEGRKCLVNISGYLKDVLRERPPSYQMKEDSTILSMVAQGLGVSVVPALAFEDLPDSVVRAELEEPLERVIGVAVPPGVLKMPGVRVFLNALKQRFPDSEVPSFAVDRPAVSVEV